MEAYIDEYIDITYPDSDGKRMADNTKQYEWITRIKGNLDILFSKRADVFVAGDLLWYPVEGQPKTSAAPDVFVAFGRPKGYRGSYKQWKEEGIAPQVVFEILSPSNGFIEMHRKLLFYEQYGVQEYYVYNPDTNELSVFTNKNSKLEEEKYGTSFWISPLLEVTFEKVESTMRLYYPDGSPFLSFVEFEELVYKERKAKEEERKAKEEERKAKEEERKAKEEERKAKEDALAEIEKLKAEIAKLKGE